jgi:hypothetical protein
MCYEVCYYQQNGLIVVLSRHHTLWDAVQKAEKATAQAAQEYLRTMLIFNTQDKDEPLMWTVKSGHLVE